MKSENVAKISPVSISSILSMLSNQSKCFALHHLGKNYAINPILLSYQSQKIKRLLMSDPLINSYTVANIQGPFEIVYDYLNQKNPEDIKSNAVFLLEIGIDLELFDLISCVINQVPSTYFLNNENKVLNRLFNIGYDLLSIVHLMSENLNQLFASEILLELPIPFIDFILKYTSDDIEPKKLVNFLSKIFSIKDSPNHRLAKYFPIKELPPQEQKEYLCNPKLNLNLQKIEFLHSFFPSSIKKKRLPLIIPFKDSDEVENTLNPGLIKAIYNQSPNKVTLSSSSVAKPTNMQDSYSLDILYKNDKVVGHYFCTDNVTQDAEPYIQIVFNDVVVQPTGYALKSWKNASNKVAPQSWKLIASSNGREWDVLDDVKDFYDLMSNSAEFYSEITGIPSFYKMFKLIQRSTGNPGKSVLALEGFEIYGQANAFQSK